MRILILGIYHDPEPIPKTGELARELIRRGHQVHVVTAFPHYPSGVLYPGYRLRPWMRETRNGVPVLRTYIYPYHGTRSLKRMLNYVTWMLSSMLAVVLTPRADVMYVWHPPLTVGVSAWVIAKLKRIRYVYDVQDLWPESAVVSGLLQPGMLVRAMQRLADWVYARAPRLFVVSEEVAEYLAARGVDRSKIEVAQHWIEEPPPVDASRDLRAELDLQARFVVMFAGNLGLVQALDVMIDAAVLLRDDPRFAFVFVGDGADRARLEQRCGQLDLSNVRFAGARPAREMPTYFAAADALFVHVAPSVVADHAIPTKMLAYLASGRPIICGMRGAAAALARAAQAGPVIAPSDPRALVEACRTLAALTESQRAEIGARGCAYFKEHFDRDRIMDFYEATLMRIAAAR